MLHSLKNYRSVAFVACALGTFTLWNGPSLSGTPAQPGLFSPAGTTDEDDRPTLDELKSSGYERSRFRDIDNNAIDQSSSGEKPEADLLAFNETIEPLLEQYCYDCHGGGAAEGNIQIDELDPDLLSGADTDWWEEVFAVVTKEEMPPADYADMDPSERHAVVEWLSGELQAASLLKRDSGSHSAFRRLTRYEYNYALQDLLGVAWDFAKDLPPEPRSEEGFQNSSELLHLSVSQFETYHRLSRAALRRATALGSRPATLHWAIAMEEHSASEWAKQREQIESAKQKFAEDSEQLETELNRLEENFRRPHATAYYKDLASGRTTPTRWAYHGARYAVAPVDQLPPFPDEYNCVAILPAGRRQNLILELGNQLPDEGTLRVTARVSRVDPDQAGFPSLQLLFGWQASNEGRALLRVSDEDIAVTGTPSAPQIVQWEIPLGEIYPRNMVRKTSPMGAIPSPSEYIRIANSSASSGDVQVDFVTIEAPVYDQWPTESYRRIFPTSENREDELAYAREILAKFMWRAWRRPITDEELGRKLDLFKNMRPQCEQFEEAILEVLATVLSSPQFLYVAVGHHDPDVDVNVEARNNQDADARIVDAYQLATRLSLFLWCSIPDTELLALAENGTLLQEHILDAQLDRMLADSRSRRLSNHFVNQWLDMELLEFANFERNVPNFDPLLKEAMQREPVALFEEILKQNASVLDFVHSDYTMSNERLARHYGLNDVHGNHFRRVQLEDDFHRGGLLTQAGLLAMNSDWPDSHPLKRAIWLLECLLADPPPPPPPAVPQIDLADPEIAKMTLIERMEDHRNQAACRSCHAKIDPWGIAFENYDALGLWRDTVGGRPVEASGELFNQQRLDGMVGLKRYLLESRQDQFVQAMVRKLATFALGRSLGFEDRAELDSITSIVRREGDGLKTLIHTLVQSDLFRQSR